MNLERENRRDFLKRASLFALSMPLLLGCRDSTLAQRKEAEDVLDLIRKNARQSGVQGMGAADVPDGVTWQTALKPKTDDGVPLRITGTVYGPDEKTPAPNVLVYFYHTDIEGIYGRAGEHKHGHYRGWLLTDARGRYEFRTIRPASYPNTTISSHVHMTVTGTDFREDWIDTILFEGDKYLTAAERARAGRKGGFNPILTLEKQADGYWHGVRDIRIDRS